MPSSVMLYRVVLVRTDVSEDRSVRRLLVAAEVVPSSPILVTPLMKLLSSSETSVLTRSTWRNFPEDGIFRKCANVPRGRDWSNNGIMTNGERRALVPLCAPRTRRPTTRTSSVTAPAGAVRNMKHRSGLERTQTSHCQQEPLTRC
jgi:hypothetical protein